MAFDLEIVGNLKRKFIHEAGHAVVAQLNQIYCHGIVYDIASARFCNLVCLPDSERLSSHHYLYLAAGVAGERIFFGYDCSQEGGKEDMGCFQDKQHFENTIELAHTKRSRLGFQPA